jgi:hypothetical protein
MYECPSLITTEHKDFDSNYNQNDCCKLIYVLYKIQPEREFDMTVRIEIHILLVAIVPPPKRQPKPSKKNIHPERAL